MTATIQKRSARAQARSILIERIVLGDLQPGERLNETALAKALGVSQTPIREALLGLEGQGYVTSKADRGFFVKPLSVSEIRAIYPVLAELEVFALKSIASFPIEYLDTLDLINDKFAHSRGEQTINLDNEWHRQLLSQCDNQYLCGYIERVRNDAHRYENMFFRDGGNIENSCGQHKAIVDMLREGNYRQARTLLKKNNLHGVEKMCDWLTKKMAT